MTSAVLCFAHIIIISRYRVCACMVITTSEGKLSRSGSMRLVAQRDSKVSACAAMAVDQPQHTVKNSASDAIVEVTDDDVSTGQMLRSRLLLTSSDSPPVPASTHCAAAVDVAAGGGRAPGPQPVPHHDKSFAVHSDDYDAANADGGGAAVMTPALTDSHRAASCRDGNEQKAKLMAAKYGDAAMTRHHSLAKRLRDSPLQPIAAELQRICVGDTSAVMHSCASASASACSR